MYNNIAFVILFSFFKNLACIFPQFVFIFSNAYSGATLCAARN